ncbi:PID-CTERM protein-sorting domain-containing protein [Pontibacter harenae]|uniref:PID-CTERM protein-sorting domain-containing protein n=1 Tax=Pontibacter harenae TaxID=2894083 RepID=UPI001E3561E7|nr:hypothetical protein [Pontibacter harenae]MCC9167200.1 hypothetical protein [Pontibacter harenae]
MKNLSTKLALIICALFILSISDAATAKPEDNLDFNHGRGNGYGHGYDNGPTQGPGNGNGFGHNKNKTSVPIDGGASLLLAAGAAYGLNRLRASRKTSKELENVS